MTSKMSAGFKLGRLKRVDLRKVWLSEPGEFTPWLAMEENIELLGEAIGMELEVEAQEKSVGPFRADILCKDTATDAWVLIENQLARTDHGHLGQLLTYAAGLNVVTIVWIAQRFADEHRAALDWLNEFTAEEINFFGLEVELWQIGDSAIAPKFNVVSSPNDWTRHIAEGAKKLVRTPAKELQIAFWTAFREHAESNGAKFKCTKPLPQHWMNISIGRTGFKLNAIASLAESNSGPGEPHELRAELEMTDEFAKSYFAQLCEFKEELHQEIQEPLAWYNPDGKRICRIYLRRAADLYDRERWPEYVDWLRERLGRLHAAFGPRVKSLNAVPSFANAASDPSLDAVG